MADGDYVQTVSVPSALPYSDGAPS